MFRQGARFIRETPSYTAVWWCDDKEMRGIVRPWRVFRGWSGTAVLLVCALVSVLLVVFVAQNFIVVEVRLLRWELDVRLSWAIVTATVLGASLGMIATRMMSR